MPSICAGRVSGAPGRSSHPAAAASLLTTILLGTSFAAGQAATPISVRSRQVELHYRLNGASPDAVIELWYTHDRGATWRKWGVDEDRTSPVVFSATSEGLYGFTMIVREGDRTSRPEPIAHEPPQCWVFIDATPPLVQWDRVEPAEDFAHRRVLQLRWTAHDDNLASRPVCLSFQSSIDQTWQVIDNAVANIGRYDWAVPADVNGRITLKISVRDEGGHVVERHYGPVAFDRLGRVTLAAGSGEASGTQPAEDMEAPQVLSARPTTADADSPSVAKSRPAGAPDILSVQAASAPAPDTSSRVSAERARLAADLYRRGSWHLVRGQYAVAAERFKEALEQDPEMLEPMLDLAGIHYRQNDYDKAIEQYQALLSRNGRYEPALYGAALAYVARKDYHQSRDMLTRLLQVNDKNADAWLDLGDVLFMMGDVTNARAHWRRATRVDPSAAEVIEKARRRLEQYLAPEEAQAARADQRR